jgi:hypothetical protein
MSADQEQLALAREIQACDVRLDLLPPSFGQESRSDWFRDELRQRRDDASRRLAELEATQRGR